MGLLPPKCKLCGAAHYSYEPHEFAKAVPKPATPSPRPSQPRPSSPAVSRPDLDELERAHGEIAALKRELARSHAEIDRLSGLVAASKVIANSSAANKVDRKAYMRELMRKKRAKAKKEKTGRVEFRG